MAVEKQQRKGKTERKWRADEETGGSYKRTQNWETSTYWLNLKSYPHLRCYEVCLRSIFV